MQAIPLKVALVGCGQIADAHLQEIRKLSFAEPVAVCDRYIDLARQAAQRFEVSGVFDNLEQMLDCARPDVLHITTPPHTHRAIALHALASGVHVYVEKPFSVNAVEAVDILQAAERAERVICVGHDQIFDPLWLELRHRYEQGDLGHIVHVDSIQGYDLTGPFGKAFATDSHHWVHQLPGGFFQNTISHALYKITEFLPDERPCVEAFWFRGDERVGFPTELRVMIKGDRTTGQLISSCACRPLQRLTRVYGSKRSAQIDFDGYSIEDHRKLSAPGAFSKLEGPYRQLRQAAVALRRNLLRFSRGDLQYFGGMNRLFAAFYRCVLGEGSPPIDYAEILRVTEIMDQIFAACRARKVLASNASSSVDASQQPPSVCPVAG